MKLKRLWSILIAIVILLIAVTCLPGLVGHLSPARANTNEETITPPDLMLSTTRQQQLQAGGTWAGLFPPSAIQNRSQVAAALFWWGFCLILGWLTYPLVRVAMPGLTDHGYPLARLAGLLLLAYPTWLAGSLGMPATRATIAIVFGAFTLVSITVARLQHRSLIEDLWRQKQYIFWIEILAVGAFIVFLLVRLGNPDLWHLYFGGEKPMDFSYFNAVLKSDTYPPYDPWFAGGVMNYYYYGFIVVGLPVKLLGITPSVAYNLILSTLFSLVILGAFSIGWNLNQEKRWLGGALAAVGVTVLGNLGAIRMVWQGWQALAFPEAMTQPVSVLQRIEWAILGAIEWLKGTPLPYSVGDWYWIPSRAVIPAYNGEITEFPLFSLIYADPHAHLIALPITLLALAWGLSVVLSRARWMHFGGAFWGLAFGALVVGSLRAANSWDHPTFLAFTCLVLGYALVQRIRRSPQGRSRKAVGLALVELSLFISLSFLFFAPFTASFRQGYNQVLPWQGTHINLASYLAHWGLFLFILTGWILDEVIDWMAHTPLSALHRLKPYRRGLQFLLLLVIVAFAWAIMEGISAAWVAVPLGLGCLLLMVRPDQSDAKRFALLLAGTGLAITLAVELFAIQGDRMNTTFKFYYQAWTFLSLGAAAGLAWLVGKASQWHPNAKAGFQIALIALVAGSAFTTLMSVKSKIIDRMAPTASHSLDGMAFLDAAQLYDGPDGVGAMMDLSADARAIRWMQQNVRGSPVIVEAHTGEYRHWGNRFTIYTGLPGIVGWENHQRQQRTIMPGDPVGERIRQVNDFYLLSDLDQVRMFLEEFQVQYIIVGQLERLYYPGIGLEKFHALSGELWDPVYSDGLTEIYQIREN